MSEPGEKIYRSRDAYRDLIKQRTKGKLDQVLELEEMEEILSRLAIGEEITLQLLIGRDIEKAINNHQSALLEQNEPVLVYFAGTVLIILVELAAMVQECKPVYLPDGSQLTNLQYAVKRRMQLDAAADTLILPPGYHEK